MLTERQGELLQIINTAIATTGVCPSYDEMAAAMGYDTKGGATADKLAALERQGYIRRQPYKPRSVVVLRLPGGEPRDLAALVPAEGRRRAA